MVQASWRNVEQVLAPTLRRCDIVIMDNVSIHKVAGVREAIEARGATLFYLPPYSPDFNPIEQFFSKLKAMLRKAAATSIACLCAVVASFIKEFPPRECAAYLVNAGYGQPYRKMLETHLPLKPLWINARASVAPPGTCGSICVAAAEDKPAPPYLPGPAQHGSACERRRCKPSDPRAFHG
jgi:transposase